MVRGLQKLVIYVLSTTYSSKGNQRGLRLGGMARVGRGDLVICELAWVSWMLYMTFVILITCLFSISWMSLNRRSAFGKLCSP